MLNATFEALLLKETEKPIHSWFHRKQKQINLLIEKNYMITIVVV